MVSSIRHVLMGAVVAGKRALLSSLAILFLSLGSTLWAGTPFLVDATTETVDGTTTGVINLIAAKGVDGKISLREAITAFNAAPDGHNTISFDTTVFPATSGATISLTSALPTLTVADTLIDASNTQVTLDANGQPAGW